MQSIAYVNASDGTANASLMTITTIRAALATEALVNTVAGVPAKFYATMGTPHTFTDPVTGETIQIISEATAVDFAGHTNSGKIEIDAIASGYVDGGSKVGDIIVIKPVTEWANNLKNILLQSLNDNGSFKTDSIVDATPFADLVDPVLRMTDMLFDYVASGAVLAGLSYGSTLTASLSAGICYINGNRQIIAAVATRTYTATKDTYVDALYNSSGTATIVYTEVTVNAASPALATNSIRLGIIQSGTTIAAVTAINQGQEYKLLPIATSRAYAVTDSLGNLICPRDPLRSTLGLQGYSGGILTTTATSFTQFAGLVSPVIVPNNGRKVKFSIEASAITCSASGVWAIALYEDGAIVQQWYRNQDTATANNIPLVLVYKKTPTAGAHTYDVRGLVSGGSMTISAGTISSSSFQPGTMQLTVEQA